MRYSALRKDAQFRLKDGGLAVRQPQNVPRLCSSTNRIWANGKFPIQKWDIFCKIKKIKGLRGDVLYQYVAQVIPQFDDEIVKNSHLWMETRLVCILLIELCSVPLAPEIARRHHRTCRLRCVCSDNLETWSMRYIEEGE
jgi:hypothetical protein